MKYLPLIEPCKSAIKEGRCLGCQALEEADFIGNKDCKIYEKRKMFEGNKKYDYTKA